LAFVGFSFIFPVIANGIRAYGIIVIGYLSDMKYATGADHLVYGWFFFSLVILCIFFTASFFADKQVKSDSYSLPLTSKGNLESAPKVAGSATVIFFSFALWGQSFTATSQAVEQTSPLLTEALVTEQSSWGIDFPQASLSTLATNANGDTYFYTARYPLWKEKGELISSSNTIFNKDIWSIESKGKLPLSDKTNAAMLSLVNVSGQSINVIYWYCVNRYCSSDPVSIKLAKASQLIRGEEGFADVYAIASNGKQKAMQYAEQWQALLQK
ncbi:exosortase/archaeosortase family protein, partial [Photobacterium sanctipauli]